MEILDRRPLKYTGTSLIEISRKNYTLLMLYGLRVIVWLKGYQNGNHIEPSEQRLQEIISIAKN